MLYQTPLVSIRNLAGVHGTSPSAAILSIPGWPHCDGRHTSCLSSAAAEILGAFPGKLRSCATAGVRLFSVDTLKPSKRSCPRRCEDLGHAEPNGTYHQYSGVLGIDPQMYAKTEQKGKLSEIPTNHDPRFAPAIHPTCET